MEVSTLTLNGTDCCVMSQPLENGGWTSVLILPLDKTAYITFTVSYSDAAGATAVGNILSTVKSTANEQ